MDSSPGVLLVGDKKITAECAEDAESGKKGRECGGTRFLQKAGFPRTPSGKNS